MSRSALAARAAAVGLVLIASAISAIADGERIDFNKARQLLQKQKAGQTLTQDEQDYLQRARESRRSASPQRNRTDSSGKSADARTSLGLTPLTDFGPGETYKDKSGGLYGDGRNQPPADHLAAALDAARQIQPLNEQGRPSDDGRIVLISNGMSNTTGEFQTFIQLAKEDPALNPRLVIVDCAQGGQEASDWARPAERNRNERPSPWEVQASRLKKAGVTPQQVQAVWLLQARRNPAALGEFPRHAEQLKQDQADVLRELKRVFPNLKLAYLSSRIYAGYAETPLNPEPYAYESAWANQWLIGEQISGETSLNANPERGQVVAPLLLWGPYLWADGVEGRKADKVTYSREDFVGDGTHPSPAGRQKVASQLLTFLKTDPTARTWFAKE